MSDDNDYYNSDDDDDLLPSPPERNIWWDYGVILAAGTLCGWLTQWVIASVAAEFGIGNIGEWAAALTPENAARYGDALRCLAAINTVGSFLLPTLLFIHFFYDLWGYEYLNADRMPRFANLKSGMLWVLAALPMIQGCYAFNAYLTTKMGMPPKTAMAPKPKAPTASTAERATRMARTFSLPPTVKSRSPADCTVRAKAST